MQIDYVFDGHISEDSERFGGENPTSDSDEYPRLPDSNMCKIIDVLSKTMF